MTTTRLKNGDIVWQAFLAASRGRRGRFEDCATTGEIAAQTGKSKPTIRAYMKLAEEAGWCFHENFGGGVVIWCMGENND